MLGRALGVLMTSGLVAQLPQLFAIPRASSCKGELGCFSFGFSVLLVACVLSGAWAWLLHKARRDRVVRTLTS